MKFEEIIKGFELYTFVFIIIKIEALYRTVYKMIRCKS